MSVVIPSFSAISLPEFRQWLDEYDALIESMSAAKPAKPGQRSLPQLDGFRYEEAVAEFQSEHPKRPMTHDDVKILVDWKLRHGKFRPTLMKLVLSNDEETVKDVIQQAIKQYWTEGDAFKALNAITKLRGIGPATASLLLSVHDPEKIIFFSDEAFYWLCCNGKKSPIKYNMKEYTELMSAAESIIKRLRVKATEVEKVAYVLMRQEAPNATSVKEGDASLSETKPAKPEVPKEPAKRRASSAGSKVHQGPVRRSKRRKAQ